MRITKKHIKTHSKQAMEIIDKKHQLVDFAFAN